MFCQRVSGHSFGHVSFVCVDTSFCIGHWLGKSMANITALEKCFCSQAAWQKWQLVQAPMYLSQVINFSPIKTPTGMMEKVGSLTFHTQASCGTLQCVGWWFLQSPIAENVQERNTFFSKMAVLLGELKGFARRLSPKFLDAFTALSHCLLLPSPKTHKKTSWNSPLFFASNPFFPSLSLLPPLCLTHLHHSPFPL